jgi:plasmid stability protein
MSRDDTQVNLRLPEGIREWIRVAAAKNGRSMNAEFVARIEASFHEEDAKESALDQIRAHLQLLIARTEPAPDGDFDAVWALQIGKNPVGADYRHWARFGWDAAIGKGDL